MPQSQEPLARTFHMRGVHVMTRIETHISQEKANLARIRDNQRRSRARRKEYLQELEARLRQCELQGIEASAEIQVAARRVADENKKLRGLLAEHGVGAESIDAHLQSSTTTDLPSGYGGSSAAVQILEQLLQMRKSCCADGANPNTHMGGDGGSRDSSGSVTTVQSLWDPVYSQSVSSRSLSGLIPGGKAASSAQQFMTPGTSTASRTSRTSSASLGRSPNHVLSSQPNHAPAHMPRNPGSSMHRNQMYDFDSELLSNPAFSRQVSGEKHLQPIHTHTTSMYSPQPTNANVNNCNYATDMITTMAGVDPSMVRAELGCLPGMDCDVDNHLVFNVMDRYSGGDGL